MVIGVPPYVAKLADFPAEVYREPEMTSTFPVQATIIIPTHNRDHLLARALNSALGQDIDDIEIIVVDDGCTDQTAEVMAYFREWDSRVRYLRIPSALGLSGGMQRNEALKVAKGRYVCYLDDDDVMTPWSVGRRLFFMDTNPEVDFCWARSFFIRNNVHHPDLDDLVTTRLVKEPGGRDVHWVKGTILPNEFMHRAGVVGEESGIWWTTGRGEDRRLLMELVESGKKGEPVDEVVAIYGRTYKYDRRRSELARARKDQKDLAEARSREKTLEADTPPPAPTRMNPGRTARLLERSDRDRRSRYERRGRSS